MGFREAIEQSGWDATRQGEAEGLCEQLRESLRRADYRPDPDQIYKNLDSDPLVPDSAAARPPASRMELLDDLLSKGTVSDEALRGAASDFCRRHKMDGPEDKRAPAHTLGRVWSFSALNDLLQSQPGKFGRAGSARLLRRSVASGSLAEQEEELGEFWLAEEHKPMWSFYDPSSPRNPFSKLIGGRGEAVDRLGLGEYYYRKPNEELVQWGHTCPTDECPRTPTAWDGGVNNPYWRPGGHTWPLSADEEGTGRFTREDGLPEVVHTPVRGRDLAVAISFVAD